MPKLKNIGFLFNHDAVHQVAHIAPIVDCLRRDFPDVKITAFVTSTEQLEQLLDIVGTGFDDRFRVCKLETPLYLQLAFKILNALAPVQRLYILKRFKSLFEELDCLLVPEMTSSRLKTHLGMQSTPLILLPHGAGDRAVGFTQEIKYFDLVLLPGTKVRDRMLAENLITADNHAIVGYPKFDAVEPQKKQRSAFFENDNPTVLYNPHFDPLLSSWYEMGIDVLEFFSTRPNFNLIFAPHVMLFKKKVHFSIQSRTFKIRRSIPEKYRQFSNIRIDLGSNSSVNMDYTLSADIYLGDVSSQLYEFIYAPGLCVFLNSHAADWRENPNYHHWHCGPVLDNVSDLSSILENIETTQLNYDKVQLKSFSETFDINETPSSLRAANSIVSFLDKRLAGTK